MEQNVGKGESNTKKLIYRDRDGMESQERHVDSKRWKVVMGRKSTRPRERQR